MWDALMYYIEMYGVLYIMRALSLHFLSSGLVALLVFYLTSTIYSQSIWAGQIKDRSIYRLRLLSALSGAVFMHIIYDYILNPILPELLRAII